MPPLSSEEILSGLIHSANSDNKILQEIEELKYRVNNLEKNINSIMQIIREMK